MKYGEIHFCQIRRNGLENILLRPIKMEETVWFDLNNQEVDEGIILSYIPLKTFPLDVEKLRSMDMNQENIIDILKSMSYL